MKVLGTVKHEQITKTFRGAYARGQEGQLTLLSSSKVAGGKRCLSCRSLFKIASALPILLYYFSRGHFQVHVNFHLSNLGTGHISKLLAVWFKDVFLGKPPDPYNSSL